MSWVMRAIVAFLLTGAGLKAAPVVVHPVDPAEGVDAPYRVQVNRASVPLERVGQTAPVYYARFSSPIDADVTITVVSAGRLEAAIKPQRLVRHLQIEGRQIAFSVTG